MYVFLFISQLFFFFWPQKWRSDLKAKPNVAARQWWAWKSGANILLLNKLSLNPPKESPLSFHLQLSWGVSACSCSFHHLSPYSVLIGHFLVFAGAHGTSPAGARGTSPTGALASVRKSWFPWKRYQPWSDFVASFVEKKTQFSPGPYAVWAVWLDRSKMSEWMDIFCYAAP